MIEFSYQNNFSLNSTDLYSSWLHTVAKEEGYTIADLGYVFCTDAFLLDINLEYLNHDTYTDIITFDYVVNTIINGEIYISTDRVLDNAKELKISFKNELYRVMVHGLLHLCGYGDATDSEKALMRSLEDKYIKLFNSMSVG